MLPTSYSTVARDVSVEIEVSRSRFRCTLARAADEDAARAVVERCRREHRDARHHCSAFIVGDQHQPVERSNDDGEPAGTAGAPMLEVLRGAQLRDVAAVVTRWFGGVLLGTGGLARAYGDAVRLAVAEAGVLERARQDVYRVRVGHALAGRLEHDLRSLGVGMLGVEYAALAELRVSVAPVDGPAVTEVIARLSGGQADVVHLGEQWVDLATG